MLSPLEKTEFFAMKNAFQGFFFQISYFSFDKVKLVVNWYEYKSSLSFDRRRVVSLTEKI